MSIHPKTMSISAAICAALREDGRAMLATIVHASGSAPAPEASSMLVRVVPPIRAIGTIGGGCLDESILFSVNEEPTRSRPRFFTFSLNDPFGDTGLTCGGTIDVLLEPLNIAALPIYEELARA